MSITLDEAWQEEGYDRMVEEILDEHGDDIISQFVAARMASYFLEHGGLLNPAVAALEEARKLDGVSPSACLVFAQATIEIALRDAVLKPVVFGMVHDENTAPLIAELAVGNRPFTKLLFRILEDHDLDLKELKRANSSKSLWEEMTHVQRLRNNILHRGEMASEEDSLLALNISEFIVEEVFPTLRNRFILTL